MGSQGPRTSRQSSSLRKRFRAEGRGPFTQEAEMVRSLSRSAWFAALLVVISANGGAQTRTLDIYWIDVEGGAATLVISPSGESLLYDAGWEVDGRDGKRIAAAVKQAGLMKIDYF